jgi:SAM-dependent methyltransferase
MIPMLQPADQTENRGYRTQKREEMLSCCISSHSTPGDLVLDCFIGSGTTAAVAQKLGRRWIGCDINKGAIQTTSRRLQTVIGNQVVEREKRGEDLIPDENAAPGPAALSFEVHRVNDYDLQIQHNEAVALACEHIGVERRKDDAYFDGTRGKALVKVVPFNHPLSPADLEQLKEELKIRPDEERNILLICLGKEQRADDWLVDWNRLRKRGDVPNKIQVIELRTDATYGKFIEHKPASAKVSIKRKAKDLLVSVEDFLSPSILERLETHSNSVITPQVKDWRSMVDAILIDPEHDGQTFHIALSDIPAKKTDLVAGSYKLPAPKKGATVAVKIIDMLGEELVITKQV